MFVQRLCLVLAGFMVMAGLVILPVVDDTDHMANSGRQGGQGWFGRP